MCCAGTWEQMNVGTCQSSWIKISIFHQLFFAMVTKCCSFYCVLRCRDCSWQIKIKLNTFPPMKNSVNRFLLQNLIIVLMQFCCSSLSLSDFCCFLFFWSAWLFSVDLKKDLGIEWDESKERLGFPPSPFCQQDKPSKRCSCGQTRCRTFYSDRSCISHLHHHSMLQKRSPLCGVQPPELHSSPPWIWPQVHTTWILFLSKSLLPCSIA